MAVMGTCKIIMDDGTQCVRPILCKGMCNTHWGRAKNGKVPMGRPFGPTAKEPKPCQLCERPAMAKGLCTAHYQRRFIRQPANRLVMDIDAPVRLKGQSDETKVDAILNAGRWVEGCLIADRIGFNGYATSVKDSEGRQIHTHRLVYRVKNGPIPKGMQVHHICATKACINPEHLVLATQKENMAEMLARLSYERHIAHLTTENARLRQRIEELEADRLRATA